MAADGGNRAVRLSFTKERRHKEALQGAAFLISIAMRLIADIDGPRHGLIRVSPQNLESLAKSLAG